MDWVEIALSQGTEVRFHFGNPLQVIVFLDQVECVFNEKNVHRMPGWSGLVKDIGCPSSPRIPYSNDAKQLLETDGLLFFSGNYVDLVWKTEICSQFFSGDSTGVTTDSTIKVLSLSFNVVLDKDRLNFLLGQADHTDTDWAVEVEYFTDADRARLLSRAKRFYSLMKHLFVRLDASYAIATWLERSWPEDDDLWKDKYLSFRFTKDGKGEILNDLLEDD